jgi:hypothetical protein
LFVLQNHPDWLWESPSLLFSGYHGSFPELKWLGYKVDHAFASGAKVKNDWSYTSVPPVCLHGMSRNYFTCTFYVTVKQSVWQTPSYGSKQEEMK